MRRTYHLSLRDRNLIRLEKFEYLEHFHALCLARSGDVRLFETSVDLDQSSFPYPFANVGAHSIYCVDITDQGRARLNQIVEINKKDYEAYSDSCRDPKFSKLFDQMLYTNQGVVQTLNTGERDQLIVYNQISNQNDYYRARDPDTEESLEHMFEELGIDIP